MAIRRIEKERRDIEKDPSPSFTFSPNPDNFFEWSVALFGPPDTPYANGLFFLKIEFPTDYPFKPPRVEFLTQIYHPNVDKNNRYSMCCTQPNILNRDWSPGFTIGRVVIARIESDLINPTVSWCRRSWGPAAMFEKDRPKFESIAREWTREHAQ